MGEKGGRRTMFEYDMAETDVIAKPVVIELTDLLSKVLEIRCTDIIMTGIYGGILLPPPPLFKVN